MSGNEFTAMLITHAMMATSQIVVTCIDSNWNRMMMIVSHMNTSVMRGTPRFTRASERRPAAGTPMPRPSSEYASVTSTPPATTAAFRSYPCAVM